VPGRDFLRGHGTELLEELLFTSHRLFGDGAAEPRTLLLQEHVHGRAELLDEVRVDLEGNGSLSCYLRAPCHATSKSV